MNKKKLNYEDFENYLDDMKSYLSSCSELDRMMYLQELALHSGLFHDAIGKVVEIKNNNIIIKTEY